MAKAKSKKKKNKPRKKAQTRDVAVNEEALQETADTTQGNVVNRISEAEEDLTAGEKLVKKAEPYFAHILLGVLSLILAWVLIKFFVSSRTETASQQWRELTTARTQSALSNDPTALREMASQYPNEKAGNWAMLMAADRDFNRGLDMLPNDRIGGLKVIEKAAEAAQVVVDSPASAKSSLVQKRSLFLAAKTNEALGKFDMSEKYYSQIIEQAPDSELVSAAKRGLHRSTSKDYAAIYDQFRSYEEVAEEAPGPLVPNKPELEFDVDIDGAPAVMPKKEEAEAADESKAFTPGEKEAPKMDAPETEAPKTEDPAMKEETKVEAEKPMTEGENPPVAEGEKPPVVEKEMPIESGTEVPVEASEKPPVVTEKPAETVGAGEKPPQ